MDRDSVSFGGAVAEHFKRGVALLLCCTVTWTSVPAWAQVSPIANPGGQQPGQQVAANGVPVVDIVAPNARGLSHNRYSRFDVGANGLILNNSASISKTELGGYVAGNTQLQNAGPATLILNEVTAASSRLQGYTEIAGSKAQLVIANPNGISCDGCGFLNTSRVTLATGTPELGSDGALAGFAINGGALSIGGNGLDAYNVDRLDLLSRQLNVDGTIWARDLVARSGRQRVGYDGMLLDVLPGSDGAAPSIGIDVAYLGGMYADRIRLIATEAGVGVVSRGTLAAQSGDLQIDSAGQISLAGTTVARDALSVNAADGVSQSGVLGSQRGAVSVRGRDVGLSGDQIAATGLDVRAGGALVHGGRSSAATIALSGAELDDHGTLYANEALALDADGLLRTGGVAYAGGGARLQGARLLLGGTLQSGAGIDLQAGSLDAGGTLDAATTLRVRSSGDARLAGQAQAWQDVDLRSGGRLDLAGQLTAGTALGIAAQALAVAATASASSGADLALAVATDLDQRGTVYAGGDLQLAARTLDNRGTTYAAGQARLRLDDQLRNDGSLVAAGALDVDAAALLSRGDLGSQQATATLRSAGGATLTGNTVAAGHLALEAGGDVALAGNVAAADATVRGAGVALDGSLQTAGDFDAAATRGLSSTAVLAAGGELRLQAAETLVQRGQLQSGGALRLEGGEVDSDGVLDAGTTLAAHGTRALTLAGIAQSGGALALATGGVLDNRAQLVSGADAELRAGELRNRADGRLSAAGGARVLSRGDVVNDGRLYAAADLQLEAQSLQQAGSAAAGQRLQARVAGTLENAGSLVAGDALDVQAGVLRSSGQLGSETGTVAMESAGDLLLGGVVAAGTALTATAGADLAQTGVLQAGSAALRAAGDLSAGGSLQTASGLDLQARQALRLDGQAIAGADALLKASELALGQGALLQAAGALALDGQALALRGTLDAGTDLALRSDGGLALGGLVQAGRDMTLAAGGALDSNAQVYADGDLALTAASARNAADGLWAAGHALRLEVVGALDNAGRVHGGGDVVLQAGRLEQDGSTFAGGALAVAIARDLDNRGSLVAHDALQLRAGQLRSSGELGSLAAQAILDSDGELDLGGTVSAATRLDARAGGDLRQAGVLEAQQLRLQAGGDLTASGALQSASTLDLQAQHALVLNGQAAAGGDATLTAARIDIAQAAVLQSAADIALDGGAIDSRGALDAGTDLRLQSAGALALAGVAQAGRDVALDATGTLTNAAQVVAGHDLTLAAAGVDNTAAGSLAALAALTAKVGGEFDNAGVVHAGEALALDTGALLQRGRLYSGDALEIVTQAGFENHGELIAGRGLRIEAGHVVSHGQLGTLGGDVEIVSAADIDLQGTVVSAAALAMTAAGDLRQDGALAAQTVAMAAGRDLAANGQLQSASTLDLQAQRALSLAGQAVAVGDARLRGTAVTVDQAAVVQSAAAITLEGTALDSRGALDAGTDLTLHSDGDLALAGIAQSGRDLALQAGGALDTGAQVFAGRDLSVRAGRAGQAAAGTLAAQGALALQVDGTVDNAGTLHAGTDLNLQAAGLQQRGSAYAGKTLVATVAGALDNQGSLVAHEGLRLDARELRSSGQLGSETAGVDLTSAGALRLGGVVAAATRLQANAGGDLAQAGTLSAQQVELKAGRDATVDGTVQAGSTLALQAGRDLVLNGQAVAGGDATLGAGRIATAEAAVLQSGGAIVLEAAAIDSRGTLDAATDLTLRSGGDLALGGLVQAGRDLALQAGGALLQTGQAVAGRDLRLTAASAGLASAAALGAQRQLDLDVAGLLDNAGRLRADGDLHLQAGALSQDGSASAGGSLAARVVDALDNRGSLIAHDALQVQAGTLHSRGQLGSENAGVDLTSTGALQLDGVVAAATALTASAGGDLQQAGALQAQSARLAAAGQLTASGTLLSASTLDLQARQALRLDGQAVAGGALTLTGARLATGETAVLQSADAITLDGAAIDSRGTLDAGTDLDLRSRGELALAGTVQAGHDLQLSATGALDNAAQVIAGHDLRLTAASAGNAAAGILLAQGDLALQTQGLLDNAGMLRAGGQLGLQVGSMRQSGQSYGAQRLGLTAAGAVDNHGDLIGGAALRVEAAQLSSQGQLGSERGDVTLVSQGDLQLAGTLASAGAFSAQAGGGLAQSGSLSAATDVVLSAQGDLEVAGQVSGQRVALDSGAVLRQQGRVNGSAVTLQAARIEQAGQTVSSGDLSLRAGDIVIGGTAAAGVRADGSLGSGSTLTLAADRQLAASGSLLAGGNLAARGEQLVLAGSTTRATGDVALVAAAGLDHRGGDLLAGGSLTVQAGGTFDNGRLGATGGQIQAARLDLEAGALSNFGGALVQNGSGQTRIVSGAGFDNREGTLATNAQDLVVTAGWFDNSNGRIEHAGTGLAALTSGEGLSNVGGRILSQGRLQLGAHSGIDNQSGAIAAAGDATLTAARLGNVGGSVSARALSVRATAGLDNRRGLLQASGGALDLRADSLSNAGGTLQAIASGADGGSLRLELDHALDNGNGLIGASTDAVIAAENLANAGGTLQAGRDLAITARGQLDNHQGGRLSAGHDLTVAAGGALLNDGGQLDSGNALTASGGRIVNSQGSIVNNGGGLTRLTTGGDLANDGGNLGGRGSVVIDAAGVGNVGGQLVAAGDLIANTGSLDNRGGNVYAGASFLLQRDGAGLDNRNGTIKAERAVRLNLQNLSNAGGQIGAGGTTGGAGDVVIDTVGFDGGGRLLAQNLLDLTLRGDYTHRAGAELVSNGDFNLSVGGQLVNEATLSATRALSVQAGNLTNRAGASLRSNDTRVATGGTIDNAGDLSGNASLQLDAGTIFNTGSIVGGNVRVQAGTLVNGADLGSATDNNAYGSALLGATGNMTLLVRDQLLNRDARIFSLGNLAIGGAQDGGGTLTARTGVVNNLSGSIEADGSLWIAANAINNQRRVLNAKTGSLTSEEREAANREMPQEQIRVDPKPSRYAGHALGVFRTYDVQERESLVAASAEGRIAAGGNIALSGSVTNNASTIAAGASLWVNQRSIGGLYDALINGNESVLNQALALNQKANYTDTEYSATPIYNDCRQPVGSRVVCYYETDHRVIGTGTIDNSYIALNASMTGGQGVAISGAEIRNGAIGSDGRSIAGASLRNTQLDGLSRRGAQSAGGVGTQAVNAQVGVDGAAAGVGTRTAARGRVQVATDGRQRDLSGASGVGATVVDPQLANGALLAGDAGTRATIVVDRGDATLGSGSGIARGQVQAGGGRAVLTAATAGQRTPVDPDTGAAPQVVGGVGAPLATIDLPIGGLYTLVGANGAGATDLGRAASDLGGINASRSSGPGRRYLIETDPRFVDYDNFISSDYLLDKLGVDPEWTHTRLGDGYYEQRLVLDQITELTGRRYLGNYDDGVAQYRALLAGGIAAADALQLSVGVGLTAAQVAALTQDIVWMVEQEYQGQKALVPVVYLASSSLELRSSGALIAGGSVTLDAAHGLVNTGTVSGTDVSLTAGSLLNQGKVAGTGTVVLQAQQDLLNLGGQVQGRDVALVAGGNLTSEAGRTVTGAGVVTGISADNNLQLIAGNDLTLSGTRVSAGNSAALQAGHDLSLQPSALRNDNGLLRGSDAVAVTTGADLLMSAGHDLQLHGVAVQAGGNAALQAGNDLSLTPSAGLGTRAGTRTQIDTEGSLQLAAGHDLTIRQAEVAAGGELIAAAGHDLNVASVLGASRTVTDQSRQGKTRVVTTTTTQALDPQALTAGGNLVLSAGHDVNLVAARLDAGQGLAVVAGNDLNATTLTTVDSRDTLETRKRFKQTTSVSDETVHGTEFSAGGDIALQAGRDLALTAASVATETGGIALAAGRDVSLLAAQEQHDAEQDMEKKKKGFLSSKTTTTHDEWHDSVAVTTSLSGERVSIAAGNDLRSQGAQIVGTGDVVLAAGNDLVLATALNTSSEDHDKQTRKSGMFGSGGLGVTFGKQKVDTEAEITQTTHTGSTVGSLEGDVTLVAGNRYQQTGSDVLALAGDIAVQAKDIAIAEAQETSSYDQQTRFKQGGLSVNLSSSALSLAQAANDTYKASKQVDGDARMQAMAAGAVALNAYNNVDALSSTASGLASGTAKGAAQGANVNISISVGGSRSQSDTHQAGTQAAGSTVQAGGDVSLIATGGGDQSNLLVRGSTITAGHDLLVAADHDVILEAARNTSTQASSNKSSSGSIGVGISYGPDGAAYGLMLSASSAKGTGNGQDVAYTESQLAAGGTATVVSGNDTSLRGAQLSADKVVAAIGGDLSIESLQDTHTYASKDKSAGGSVTIGAGFSASGSYSSNKVNGDYASVVEQSGIQAGNGGFDLDVAGNTDLKGGVIASTRQAVDEGRNRLSTGTLTYSDLANASRYDAQGVNLSGGYSKGAGGETGTDGSPSTVNNGSTWSWQNFQTGTTGGAAGYVSKSGESNATTASGIGGGTLVITDEAGQLAKTGQSASEALAGLKREVATGDAAGGLTQQWDAQKLQSQVAAGAQITAAFGQQASKAVGDYAQQKIDEAALLRAQAEAASDPGKKADLTAQAEQLESQWGDGGSLRLLAHTVIGGLTGGLEGAAGAATGTLTAPKVAEALREAGVTGPLADSLTALASGAVGAAAGGANGAAAAGNEVANNWLSHREIAEADLERAACDQGGGDVQACKDAVTRRMDALDVAREKEWLAYKESVRQEVSAEQQQGAWYSEDEYKRQELARQTTYWAGSGLKEAEAVFTGYAPAGEAGYLIRSIWNSGVNAIQFLNRPGLLVARDMGKALAQEVKDGATALTKYATAPLPAAYLQGGIEQSLTMTTEERSDALVGVAFSIVTDGILAKTLPTRTAGGAVDGAGGIADAPKTIPYEPTGSVVLQGNAPVCGPACAAMTITDNTGKHVSLDEAVGGFVNGVRSTGVNTLELSEVISNAGVKNQLNTAMLPEQLAKAIQEGSSVIIQIPAGDGRHFIIVDSVKSVDGVNYYMTRDPYVGPRGVQQKLLDNFILHGVNAIVIGGK